MKCELEDLAFRYVDADGFASLSAAVALDAPERDAFV